MKRLVIQRLFSAIGVVLGACALVFLILYMLPGDPVQRMLDGAPADENTIMHLREQLGLDLPLHQQFLNYMGNLLQGDFGTPSSLRSRYSTVFSNSCQQPFN